MQRRNKAKDEDFERSLQLPQHIAIIMDGNGRWAKKRFMPRILGHRAGIDAARKIVISCAKKNIKILSLFAFSSENWRRPTEEVSFLMDLFLSGLNQEVAELNKNNVQLRFIGERSHLSEKLQQKMLEAENVTANNTGLILIIAVNYGGQWDIYQAVCQLAKKIERGDLSSSEITSQHIANHLSFADLPDPDLFIRTSGEIRVSNFMLWQLAYSELYFTPTLWPDFDEAELEKALLHYSQCERRYGYSSEQLSSSTCLDNA